ncbi:unnamed protein product [Rotaria sp. Silwood1]|nr:unnamed protein product [Rotaria sp. Silwood1]
MQYTLDILLLNRKTVFEDLSSELFFELFDFFHFTELYNTFAHLNRRIDGYLAQLSNIHLDLSSTKYKLITKLNERQILSIKSLKYITFEQEDQHEKQEFFIQYPLKLFRQLRSLSLRLIITTTDLPMIIDQLPLLTYLTSLSIAFNLFQSKLTADDLRRTYEIIFHSCTHLKTLKFAIMDHNDSRKRTHNVPLFNQPITTNIEYLNIYQLYFDEFDCILSPSFLPRVKSLTATIYDNPPQQDFLNDGLTVDFLTNLVVNFNWGFTFTYLESIFKRTPNLKSFLITSSPITLIDCQKWQYFLSRYLVKVEKFHLHACDWEQRQWSKRNEYIDFQTSTYWMKERDGVVKAECQQSLDEEGNGLDSISITFTTTIFKNIMPKRKTGQRKKAEKQKERQKLLQSAFYNKQLVEWPCNFLMDCDKCKKQQKNRAFCYFCQALQALPVCAQCGKQKCLSKTGDCLVKHGSIHATGLQLVGAICDFCEAWICHSKKCLTTHPCQCPLQNGDCIECNRSVWEHGGRVFQCSFCNQFLCEDDQFEHQASCQVLESENYKCASCSKHGQWSCLRCKVCYCDEHIRRRGFKYTQGEAFPCPKCNFPTKETKDLSMSTRAYGYGRKVQNDYEDDDGLGINSGCDYFIRGEGSQNFTFGGKSIEERAPRDDDDESDEDEDEDEDEEEDEEEEEEDENEEDDDDNDNDEDVEDIEKSPDQES